MAILTVIGALSVSVLAKLLADELKAWCPKICDRLILCAASQLLPFQRGRYIEQWRSDVEQFPGDLYKLYFAADLFRGQWLTRVLPSASRAILSTLEEELAAQWLVFLQIACMREKVRLIMENCGCSDVGCPTFCALNKLYKQITAYTAESGEKLFNDQKRLSCGRLSDKAIAGRMVQRVIENNSEMISTYRPFAKPHGNY